MGKATDLEMMSRSGEDKVLAKKIYTLASKGYARKKIRTTLKITTHKWYQMMSSQVDKHPIYKEALDRGELVGIEEVEQSLKEKSIGQYVVEKTVDDYRGVKTTRKYIPADTKAIIFYLTNKKPGEYKLRRDDTVTINSNSSIDYNKLDTKTLKKLLAASDKDSSEYNKLLEASKSDTTDADYIEVVDDDE